jgi:hypothetical protein
VNEVLEQIRAGVQRRLSSAYEAQALDDLLAALSPFIERQPPGVLAGDQMQWDTARPNVYRAAHILGGFACGLARIRVRPTVTPDLLAARRRWSFGLHLTRRTVGDSQLIHQTGRGEVLSKTPRRPRPAPDNRGRPGTERRGGRALLPAIYGLNFELRFPRVARHSNRLGFAGPPSERTSRMWGAIC